MTDWILIGALCGFMAVLWLWDLFATAPEEDFDKDLAKKEQESEAQGVVDSMRGELDYMRRDGLL